MVLLMPRCSSSVSSNWTFSSFIHSSNSSNVNAAETNPSLVTSSASCFLAMHGPMNTTLLRAPYTSLMVLACAKSGETTGARYGSRSG